MPQIACRSSFSRRMTAVRRGLPRVPSSHGTRDDGNEEHEADVA